MKIGTPVEFESKQGIVSGHLYKKGTRRNRAEIIDGLNRLWRVPEVALKVRPGKPRNTIVTPTDIARSKFRVGDLVQFPMDGIMNTGILVKLNPTRAIVAMDKTGNWRVPYAILKLHSSQNSARPGEDRLKKTSELARTLMDSHGLQGWNFRFDESSRFLGKCNFRDQIIQLSRDHVLDGRDEDIKDTILHEIAHAIAGPIARHGPAWKMVAIRIGAKPYACFKPEE